MKKVDIAWSFVIPSDGVLEAAGKLAASSTPDEQSVGKAVLALSDVSKKTKAAIEDTKNEGTFDLSPYFDFAFGDSLEAAKRLEASADKDSRNVSKTLLALSQAVSDSKAAFSAATKS